MGKTLRSTLIALAASLVAMFAFSAVAGAQDNGPYVGNQVSTTSTTQLPPTAPPEVQSNAESYGSTPAGQRSAPTGEVQSSRLAFTGSDAATMALIGVVAIGAGGSILLVRRRSTN